MKQNSTQSWKEYITSHALRMRRAKLQCDSIGARGRNRRAVMKDYAKLYLLEEILMWLKHVLECEQKDDVQSREFDSVKLGIEKKCNALISLYGEVVDMSSMLISQGEEISSSVSEHALIKAVKCGDLKKLYWVSREMAFVLAVEANIDLEFLEETDMAFTEVIYFK